MEDDGIILDTFLHALYFLARRARFRLVIIICEVYGNEYDLLFNPEKCYLLIFSCPDLEVNENISVYICGEKVKIMSQEIHLGNVLSTEGNLINMDKAINDMKSRTVAIMNNFNNVSFKSKVTMFNSQCMALYGSQLWNLSDSNINKLSITWRKSVRYLLGLPP